MITSVNEDANTYHLVGPGYTWMNNAYSLLGSQQGSIVSAMIHDGDNTVWEEKGAGCRGVETALAESNW